MEGGEELLHSSRISLMAGRKRRWFSTTFTTTGPTPDASSSSVQEQEQPLRVQFSDLQDLHPLSKMALDDMHLTTLTEIQQKTWEHALSGKDILGRARTGTGKTIAFLLPSIQRLLTTTNNNNQNDDTAADAAPCTGMIPGKINMLIISPTRELAQQIATETRRLLKYHHPLSPTASPQQQQQYQLLTSQAMYGGVPKYLDLQRLQTQIPTILTATPGRLLDHIQSTKLPPPPPPPATAGSSSSLPDHGQQKVAEEKDGEPFRNLLSGVQILVLDEMDSLLDMGFRDTIRDILKHLPKEQHRQTLLFSATSSAGVQQMVRRCIRKDEQQVVVVDCTDENNPTSLTNTQTQQSHVLLSMDQVVWSIVRVIQYLAAHNPRHKILVFFPTTAQVTFFARLLQHGLGMPVLEMHGQLSQGRRSVVSDRFRHARGKAVLLTTDVSARGVDYPNVSHVVQVGAAPNQETYLHRLGRTGRAGRQGEGILLLTQPEVPFLHRDLEGWKIQPNERLQHMLHRSPDRRTEENRMRLTKELRDGDWPELEESIKQVYIALLGYYASRIRNWSSEEAWKDELVVLATEYCRQVGLNEMPPLPSRLAEQLDLAEHPGVVIRERWDIGRTFNVGLRQEESLSSENIWSGGPSLTKKEDASKRGRSSVPNNGLWEDEFDA